MWGMGAMGLGWILVLAAIAGVVWYLVNATRGTPPRNEDSPTEILKRRYARGEIDTETYEKTLRELTK